MAVSGAAPPLQRTPDFSSKWDGGARIRKVHLVQRSGHIFGAGPDIVGRRQALADRRTTQWPSKGCCVVRGGWHRTQCSIQIVACTHQPILRTCILYGADSPQEMMHARMSECGARGLHDVCDRDQEPALGIA